MTVSAVETKTATGRVVRVIGPVVDAEFPRDGMPDLFNALHVNVTLSGGEPTFQAEFSLEILSRAKDLGLSTCVETCGFGATELFIRMLPYVDLFLWDIKDTDHFRHIADTGAPIEPIIDNLNSVDKAGGKIVLRCILLQGLNLNDQHLDGIARISSELSNCVGVELLPFHPLGASKFEKLGLTCSVPFDLVPSEQSIADAVMYIATLIGPEKVMLC